MTDPAPLAPVALGRVGEPGAERPVVLVDGAAFDARPVTDDITPGFLERGGLDPLVAAARAGALPATDVGGERIGPPTRATRRVTRLRRPVGPR